MRTGLITKKVGMSRVFREDGVHLPVTLLHLDRCQVVSVLTASKNGYDAIQLGFGYSKKKNVSKSLLGHYSKAHLEPFQKLVEFRVNAENLLKVGDEISVTHFIPGQYVDASGVSIGKGFSGGMKRHNFGGLRASHGVSISHRSHGSTGNRQNPGRVFKGKKMAGHLGHESVTIQNIEIHSVDVQNNLILVIGSVPGAKGSYVILKDSIKIKPSVSLPYPAGLKSISKQKDSSQEAFDEDALPIQVNTEKDKDR